MNWNEGLFVVRLFFKVLLVDLLIWEFGYSLVRVRLWLDQMLALKARGLESVLSPSCLSYLLIIEVEISFEVVVMW